MRWLYLSSLWWLAAVPLLVVAYAVFFARRTRLLDRVGDPVMVQRMTFSVSLRKKYWKAALFVLAVGCLAAALGRPQAGGTARLVKKHGLDLVVALDFSKSMLARDVYPSRIERAKQELGHLLDELPGDRIGLVAFAGETIRYPLTTDAEAAKLFWRDLRPEDMPVGGTAIGRALEAAVDMLKQARSSGRPRAQVILLLTDGEDTEGQAAQAAAQAASLGIRIYAVGLGTPAGELVPVLSESGALTGYLHKSDGSYVTSRLDTKTLESIAHRTGGEFYSVDPKRFGIEAVRAALKGLARAEHEARLVKQYEEAYEWFALPALLLLVGEALLGDRKRFRERRRAPGSAMAKPATFRPRGRAA